ncbi:MAG: hypothetical protein ACREQ9_14275, partial [Candidatus Binatia bacterium]
MRPRRVSSLIGLAMVVATTAAAEAVTYGDLEFPKDEHQHLQGLDYWWGAADVFTTAGNHYTVGVGWASFNGYVISGHQVIPHQGAYDGSMILSADGPAEWGHPEVFGDFVRAASVYVPGVSDLLTVDAFETRSGLRNVSRWERTTLDREEYRFRLDQPRAKIHPSGERIPLSVDLTADMQGPPLLAGGAGTWWYELPQTYGYPSRSFQYMQAAEKVTGTLRIAGGPTETVDSTRSRMVMTHEYDATPEDIPAGLGVAMSTQLHPTFFTTYQGGMPWELFFLDLGNGAQLMVAVLAFHDTPDGTAAPIVGPDQSTYRVLATIRLPSGESVPLDDVLH